MDRRCGVLLHISSLPSPYGIGTLGKAAYDFVDCLNKAQQTYWQILPLMPTGFGGSPYQGVCTFAGNPLFIDLDLLAEEGLLTRAELNALPHCDANLVDFEAVHLQREGLLDLAYRRGVQKHRNAFTDFKLEHAEWLADYAMFSVFQKHFDGAPLSQWDAAVRERNPEAVMLLAERYQEQIESVAFAQYLFDRQWKELRAYATQKGIRMIGDVPIYVAPESSEVWANRELFLQDGSVAGCPPDYFCSDGQHWGNPLYDWESMRLNGFEWWVRRMRHCLNMFDYVRVDHFRGLQAYFYIPREKHPRDGHWVQGPGYALFDRLREELGELPILAEDLGFLTPEVFELIDRCGFPGTKVLQFAFDEQNSIYLPHNYPQNCVVYTGTHDNETTRGWFSALGRKSRHLIREYAGEMTEDTVAHRMIRLAMMSTARFCIIPMQDILNLDSSARMNTPSTVGGTNWRWRMQEDAFSPQVVQTLYDMAVTYGRARYDEPAEAADEPQKEKEFMISSHHCMKTNVLTNTNIPGGNKMKIDFNNMLATNIGEHGLTDAEIAQWEPMLGKVHQNMCDKKAAMAWRSLPYNQDAIVADIVAEGKRINEKFDAFVVLGIGGSALGSKALFTGVKHLKYNELPREKRGGARFYVADNVDPDGLNALFDILDVKKTCFHVITKSGNTVETMSQFMIVMGALQEALGDSFKDNIILTTDKEKGILKKISNQYGFKTYTVPDGVGGRFSVLCPVGLLSAAVLNIDIDALFAGAKAMDDACTKENVWENPAYLYAMLYCTAMKKGANISVMMPYADGLLNMAEWYAQLWAESLGKRFGNDGGVVNCGQTPVRALGVTDQHSQIQLYTEGPFDKIITFIDVQNFNTKLTIPKPPIDMMDATYIEGQTINKLIAAEMQATEYAVCKSGKMNMRITLDKMDASAIGGLFFFLEMATAAAGEFLEIDAFDQPGVEEGKIATFALMGREGYEDKAKELSGAAAKDAKFILTV